MPELSKDEVRAQLPSCFARLAVITNIEIVPLRQNGSIEVLLTKREDTDKHWPGMYHVPGPPRIRQ